MPRFYRRLRREQSELAGSTEPMEPVSGAAAIPAAGPAERGAWRSAERRAGSGFHGLAVNRVNRMRAHRSVGQVWKLSARLLA
ncbi:hypothetical protein GCM10028798_32280 [Humibacter antri]